MKNKIIYLFSVLFILLTLLFYSCDGNSSISTDSTQTGNESSTPEQSNTEQIDSTAAETTEKDAADYSASTLIYKEDFENSAVDGNTDSVVSALGWKIQNTSDGAYKNNSAKYTIVERNGGKSLYINNFNNGQGGNDSYVSILTDDQFGYFNKRNYTFQYDLEYTDAENAQRYIALVNGYNGSFYYSFHFRIGGYGNNECHSNGSWASFESTGNSVYAADNSNTSKKTLAYLLIGKKVNTQSIFKNISVTVRYEVDWENGNKVFMRVNDPTSHSKGEWVLVSYTDKNSDGFKKMWSNGNDGSAFVLKVGGAVNGYIDNIMIWCGTDCEPNLESPQVLTSKVSGHVYVKENNVRVCQYCGLTEEKILNFWLLDDDIPKYTCGTPSKAVYATGQGFHDRSLKKSNESPMQIFSQTSEKEYLDYLTVLEKDGYKNEYTFSDESGRYNSYVKGDKRLYVYYTAAINQVRIIDDKVSQCSPDEFGYVYEKKTGDNTTLYQYGLPMNQQGVGIKSNDEKKIDCGMLYFIKLADNSIFIIDGGGHQQFDKAQKDNLMLFLENITGAGKNEKIRIAGWFITHTHSDHFAGLCLFFKDYGSRFTLERVFCNLPSVYSSDSSFAGSKGAYQKLLNYISNYLGNDYKFIKLHTGENITLADIKIRVIFTHEDLVNSTTATTEIAGDFNNSSTVLRIEFDGKSFMMLGDINQPSMKKILKIVPSGLLKCDIAQVAHHVINDLSSLYKVCQAPVVFVPQSPGGASRYQARIDMMNTVKTYVKNDMLFYASLGTYGVEVKDGKIEKVFEDKVYGGAYVTDWGW